MNYLKNLYTDYRKIFTKFWTFQIVISLLGVMITWPLSALANSNPEYSALIYISAVIFCGGMFCFLVYDTFFQLGAKEYIKTQNKTITYEPLKGLKMTAIAYSPTMLIILLSVIFYFTGLGDAFASTSVILNIVIHAMFSGLIFIFPDSMIWLAFVLSAIPALVAGFLGYFIPLQNKTIRGMLGFKVKINKE